MVCGDNERVRHQPLARAPGKSIYSARLVTTQAPARTFWARMRCSLRAERSQRARLFRAVAASSYLHASCGPCAVPPDALAAPRRLLDPSTSLRGSAQGALTWNSVLCRTLNGSCVSSGTFLSFGMLAN